nr:hypothetical protein GCM10017745_67550 [Saccharothrix mutabilis subsp. capreolus]
MTAFARSWAPLKQQSNTSTRPSARQSVIRSPSHEAGSAVECTRLFRVSVAANPNLPLRSSTPWHDR